MTWAAWAAAGVFAATFLLLAAGRVGRLPVPRGAAALAGGAATFLILAPSGAMPWRAWALVDWQVILLLAGLMVLAGLAEAAGLFAGLRRRLVRLPPGLALWAALAVVAVASAAILNDAAVAVLVPFLLPALRSLGLPAVPVVALMAAAANAGSLLTPFGNPQVAVLARSAGLGVLDFLRDQGPLVLLALALLGAASWRLGRRAAPAEAPAPAPAVPRGRPWIVACIAAFLAAAGAGAPGTGLGGAAALAALAAYAGLRPRLGREAGRAAWRSLDRNVLSLFLGLYLLTAGLPAWLPAGALPLAALDAPISAALATTALSNAVGNVPAILAFLAIDPAWTAGHAAFLASVSTLGGALLLTGSAASLIAADQARRQGVVVGFWAFARHALPPMLPVLAVAVWWSWPATAVP